MKRTENKLVALIQKRLRQKALQNFSDGGGY